MPSGEERPAATRSYARVLRLLGPAVALAAVLAHAGGAGGLGFGLLLLAVPAAAAGALEAVGEVVEERCSPAHAVLAGLGLALVVGAAAVRAPALALGCVVAFALQEVAALLLPRPLPDSERASAS